MFVIMFEEQTIMYFVSLTIFFALCFWAVEMYIITIFSKLYICLRFSIMFENGLFVLLFKQLCIVTAFIPLFEQLYIATAVILLCKL